MNPTDDKELIAALTASKVYQDYERAFNETTGLPVTLRTVDSWQLPHHGRRKENPFCGLMARKSRSCAACLQTQQKLSDCARTGARTVSCALGLSDTAVPVQTGDRLVGFLQTGQVFFRKPGKAQFERALALCKEWGVEVEEKALREAYFATPVVPGRRYDWVVRLLGIFAEHIGMISNQILLRRESAEPPVITRAREYIQANQSEELSLDKVARAVNTSRFYFCKIFKKHTGLNFTDYVSRIRIERARNLLLNPNLRVSEIAYEIGFQSLTHFNRVFKKVAGMSPTAYRAKLPSV
jgi:AraC-like DNA-binding protein/ligand-binding sensor protein